MLTHTSALGAGKIVENVGKLQRLSLSRRVAMENNVIQFPRPEPSDGKEMLWLELEIAERRVEDIKRQLGILATERGLDSE